MVSILLATLLTLNHISYDHELFSQPLSAQTELASSLLKQQGSYSRIVKSIPPLRQRAYVFPDSAINVASGILIDERSGAVLWEKRSDDVRPLASLTKLMTALTFLDEGRDFSQEVTMMGEDETEPGGSTLKVKAGEKLTVGDLFHAMLIGSANNAANSLVRSTGTERSLFITTMNEKAKKLGLSHTNFVDVTGLDPANISIASEFAVIARMAFRNERIVSTLRMPEYKFETVGRKIPHTIRTTNVLLQDEDLPIEGGKTGYLEEAGFTYVALSGIGSRQIVLVLLGSESSERRFQEARALIEWALRNYEWF